MMSVLNIKTIFHHAICLAWHGSIGVVVTLIAVVVLYLNDRPDLSVWHLVELDEEFSVDSDVSSFKDYLALEDRLFQQLDDEVYAQIEENEKSNINRY